MRPTESAPPAAGTGIGVYGSVSLVSPHRQAYAVKEGKMQGRRRIIFFKSLIDKTALCGADVAVAGVGGPVLRSFCGAAVLWRGADGVRAADHPGLLPEESGAVPEICRCGNVAGGHRLTGGLTGPRSDTGACRGSFFRTRWRTWGSSRYRPCSGCSLCPRRAWRPGG